MSPDVTGPILESECAVSLLHLDETTFGAP